MDSRSSTFPPVDFGRKSVPANGFSLFSYDASSSVPRHGFHSGESNLQLPAPYRIGSMQNSNRTVIEDGFPAYNFWQNYNHREVSRFPQMPMPSGFGNPPYYHQGTTSVSVEERPTIPSTYGYFGIYSSNGNNVVGPRVNHSTSGIPFYNSQTGLQFQWSEAVENFSIPSSSQDGNQGLSQDLNLDNKFLQKVLLLYFHSIACTDQRACSKKSCTRMKWVIIHMKQCKISSCRLCGQIHCALRHYQNCQEHSCETCLLVRTQKVLDFDAKSKNPASDLHEPPSKRLKTGDFAQTSEAVEKVCDLALGEMTEPLENPCKTEESGLSDKGREPLKNSFQESLYLGLEHKTDDRLKSLPEEGSTVERLGEMQEKGNELSVASPGENFSGEEMKPFTNSSQGSSVPRNQVRSDDSDTMDEEIVYIPRVFSCMKPCENQSKIETSESDEIMNQNTETSTEDFMECGEEHATYGNDAESTETSGDSPATNCEEESEDKEEEIEAVSLVESFSLEQVIAHMDSFKEWVGLGKTKAAKNQALENLDDKNSCQLCGMGALSFEPPPLYCNKCTSRIKHKRTYYTVMNLDAVENGGSGRVYLCNLCFKGTHGDSVRYPGGVLLKTEMTKRRNDIEVSEQWVECGKCQGWQHQTCALFNPKRNMGGKGRYMCPRCQVEGIKSGKWRSLPEGIFLGAEDLPKSNLSDYIEQWLFQKLARERKERAEKSQTNLDDIPTAENLTVRVVSSVDKRTEVKPIFQEIFEGKDYPSSFPYKSKAILLFQKIEGADVCLFAMYVQEYDASCPKPNERRISLSYLDSVKYFQPDIRCVTGEALRTFVYHEILIGYLDYCKRRGFRSCHIWSCPPLKQEDFILNCHPEIQKTPKPEKLREWYLAMIKKATEDNIVVGSAKLYDIFCTPSEGSQTSLTAASLPYFEGDYWPGLAIEFLESLKQIEEGKEPEKKGRMAVPKRALKASRHCSSPSTLSKDSLLMLKLVEALRAMKDDFVVIQLQYTCTHCGEMISGGKRWACDQCKNFNLCNKCHDAELSRGEKDRHPVNRKVNHSFHSVDVEEVPPQTDDMDENIQNELLDNRITFLALCQGNHYQYDTLRRAKHSTMMILYHLHNPSVSAHVVSCFHCNGDIEQGQGWRCETCSDYDICDSCHAKDLESDHPHELVSQRESPSGKIPRKGPSMIQNLMRILVHASECNSCASPLCWKLKVLFRHGASCEDRVRGGCELCQKIWFLLKRHAGVCTVDDDCHVPRCRDIKDLMRKQEPHSNSRRLVTTATEESEPEH